MAILYKKLVSLTPSTLPLSTEMQISMCTHTQTQNRFHCHLFAFECFVLCTFLLYCTTVTAKNGAFDWDRKWCNFSNWWIWLAAFYRRHIVKDTLYIQLCAFNTTANWLVSKHIDIDTVNRSSKLSICCILFLFLSLKHSLFIYLSLCWKHLVLVMLCIYVL